MREDPQQKRRDKEAVQALNNLRGWIEKKNRSVLPNLHISDFANHSKILIKDDDYAIAGSFNWLSNSGRSQNQERSWIVYDKEFILDEKDEAINHCETHSN